MKKKSIVENFLFQLIYQLVIMFVPFITAPYLARTLGAQGVGTYSFYYTISNCFVLLTKLGIDNYGAREIAKIPLNDRKLLSEKFCLLFSIKLIMGIISLILYLMYVILFVKTNKIVSLIFSLYIISGIIDVNWFYMGIENFRYISIRNMAIKILVTILIFSFVKSSDDLELYTLIMIGGTYFLSQFIGWGGVIKNITFSMPKRSDVVKCIKPMFILFVPVLALNMYRQMDKIMLGAISGTVQVGLYDYAEKIYMICIAVISVCADVAMPRIASCLSTGQKEKAAEFGDAFIDFSICMSAAMAMGILAISDRFINLFYSAEFSECSELLKLLAPSIMFLGISIVTRKVCLIPYDLENIFLKASCIGAIVNFVLNLILIPHMDSRGAVTATVTTEFVVMLYQFIKIRENIPIKKYIFHFLWFLTGSATMYFIIYKVFSDMVISWKNIFLEILLGAVIYSIFAIIFIFNVYNSKMKTLFQKFKNRFN